MKVLWGVLFLFCSATLFAQSLPLGTVQDNGPTLCSTGFQTGASCRLLVVSCPNVIDINVTIGTTLGLNNKLVILANGSGWTVPGLSRNANFLAQAGYSTAMAAWSSDWEQGQNNILQAACRPATLINYLAQGQTFAVMGASGGSGATAYAMTWYGITPVLFESISGPVFSDINQGCETPKAQNVEVLPTNGTPWSSTLYYNAGVPSKMSVFTGQTCLSKSVTTQQQADNWLNQSILAPGGLLSYTTIVHAWLCATAQYPNNSSGQGFLWLSKITSPWSLTAMTGCQGSENINPALTPQNQDGFDALMSDLELNY